jgi:hypothetical protein
MFYEHDLYYRVSHLSYRQILMKFYFGDSYLKFNSKYEHIVLLAN